MLAKGLVNFIHVEPAQSSGQQKEMSKATWRHPWMSNQIKRLLSWKCGDWIEIAESERKTSTISVTSKKLMTLRNFNAAWEVFIHARGQRVISELINFSLSCRVCYFRIHKAICGVPGKCLDDLNASFGSGVLTCHFEGHDFKAFMKWMMKNYFRLVNL